MPLDLATVRVAVDVVTQLTAAFTAYIEFKDLATYPDRRRQGRCAKCGQFHRNLEFDTRLCPRCSYRPISRDDMLAIYAKAGLPDSDIPQEPGYWVRWFRKADDDAHQH